MRHSASLQCRVCLFITECDPSKLHSHMECTLFFWSILYSILYRSAVLQETVVVALVCYESSVYFALPYLQLTYLLCILMYDVKQICVSIKHFVMDQSYKRSTAEQYQT